MVYELQRSVSQIAAGGLNSMKYVMDEHAKQKDAGTFGSQLLSVR